MQIVVLLPFLQPWPVKTLQNVCPHLISSAPPCLLVSTQSCSSCCLWHHLLGFFYCHVPSLLPGATTPPSSKHSWIQFDIPLVQNSISSDNLILDDPILERYLCLESRRSRIPLWWLLTLKGKVSRCPWDRNGSGTALSTCMITLGSKGVLQDQVY